MKQQILIIELIGYVITAGIGAIMFFLYEWSGESIFAASFSLVNESVWEHTKLIFWPCLFITLIEYVVVGRRWNNFIFHKAVAFLISFLFYVSIFYTYSGILGFHHWMVDMFLYLSALCVFYRFSYSTIFRDHSPNHLNYSGFCIFYVISFFYVFCTFKPPHISLFESQHENSYGIEAYSSASCPIPSAI